MQYTVWIWTADMADLRFRWSTNIYIDTSAKLTLHNCDFEVTTLLLNVSKMSENKVSVLISSCKFSKYEVHLNLHTSTHLTLHNCAFRGITFKVETDPKILQNDMFVLMKSCKVTGTDVLLDLPQGFQVIQIRNCTYHSSKLKSIGHTDGIVFNRHYRNHF